MNFSLLILLSLLGAATAFDKYPKEFVFELPDNEEFCFYEEFAQDATKEAFNTVFRVIRGGNNDVDFAITAPDNQKVYEKQKQHFDEHEHTFRPGTYSFCFGNKFSTITHKQIYFALNRKRPESLAEEAGATNVPTAMSLLQTKMEAIHEYLVTVETVQSIYKVREAEGREISEDLNERVMVFSAILAMAVVVCGFGQVVVLRTFFSDKKSVSYPRYPTKA
ncbi:hypothetical protein BOX15_Mlig004258g1 [Macrostomum lignano]|uniref:GOLD domain-containing protein n=1 Tax=Macrostomum lignano TaxID=282301 RepID=A0A267FCW8_9PLAT|nr:hypothetical protein BOX15_Mlig004258g1 [Macrostomum lignano]